MLKRYFNLVIIPKDKQKPIVKLKIYWLLLLIIISVIAALIYLLSDIYYLVFFQNQNLKNIDQLNAANQIQESSIEEYYLKKIDSIIQLDLLKSLQDNLVDDAEPKTQSTLKDLDENELLKKAAQDGLLAIIEDKSFQQNNITNLSNFYDYIKKPTNIANLLPSIRPVQGIILAEFGSQGRQFFDIDESLQGIIVGTRRYENVIAPADGIVVASGLSHIFGYYMEIYHGFGIISGYYNLQKPDLRIGDQITKHQNIGTVALNTKHNNSYLYYQIAAYGIPQNPILYFEKY